MDGVGFRVDLRVDSGGSDELDDPGFGFFGVFLSEEVLNEAEFDGLVDFAVGFEEEDSGLVDDGFGFVLEEEVFVDGGFEFFKLRLGFIEVEFAEGHFDEFDERVFVLELVFLHQKQEVLDVVTLELLLRHQKRSGQVAHQMRSRDLNDLNQLRRSQKLVKLLEVLVCRLFKEKREQSRMSQCRLRVNRQVVGTVKHLFVFQKLLQSEQIVL